MNKQEANNRSVTYRPRLSFYHANARCTGCALQLELHPAHDEVDGSIMLSAASQLSVGDRNCPKPTFSRFDWEHKLCVKLSFSDLSKVLQVFRGEKESLEDGRGLIHNATAGITKIALRHLLDPVAGYSFELYRKTRIGAEQHVHFMFSPYEALGLSEAISGSMSVISFGIPMVIPHHREDSIKM